MVGKDDGHTRAKPPVDDLVLPYGRQIAIACAATVGFLGVLAAGIWWKSEAIGSIAAFCAMAAAGTGVIIAYHAGDAREGLRAIRAGDYRVHWRYPDFTWRELYETERTKAKWLFWAMPPMTVAFALFPAFFMVEDQQYIGDGAAQTYLAMAGGGAVLGLIAGGLFASGKYAMLHLMRTRTPQCVLSDHGLYFTGQYWPFRAGYVRLVRLDHAEGPPGELKFKFLLLHRRGAAPGWLTMPVPPGEEGTAKAFAEDMKDKLGIL